MSLNEVHLIDPVWQRRACPICESSNIPPHPNSSAKKPAERMTWEEAKSYFVGLRHDQVFFSYYRCLECELLYCPWYFTKDQISILYSEMPDNTMGEDKSTLSKTQSTYAKWILQGDVCTDSYLEIGPDIGLVSRAIIAIKTPKKVTFIEPNLSVRQELIKSASKVNSIEVVDFIEDLNDDNFSLIVGVHVYDHLLDPIQDLRELSHRADKGAHISIVVHNEKSCLRKLLSTKWPPFCLQHPQLYNPKTLDNLLKQSGWSTKKIEKSTNWYHLRYFIRTTFSVLGVKDRLTSFLPNFEFPIRLGNMICLAKRSEKCIEFQG